jgi:hypothetical protein
MELLQRLVCVVIDHRYTRVKYPGSPDGYYLHCLRCGHDRSEPYIDFNTTSAIKVDSGAHTELPRR